MGTLKTGEQVSIKKFDHADLKGQATLILTGVVISPLVYNPERATTLLFAKMFNIITSLTKQLFIFFNGGLYGI